MTMIKIIVAIGWDVTRVMLYFFPLLMLILKKSEWILMSDENAITLYAKALFAKTVIWEN